MEAAPLACFLILLSPPGSSHLDGNQVLSPSRTLKDPRFPLPSIAVLRREPGVEWALELSLSLVNSTFTWVSFYFTIMEKPGADINLYVASMPRGLVNKSLFVVT